MTSLLAGDLAILGWDDARGKPAWRASSTLNMGIAGALLLDAVLAEALRVEDERVEVTGHSDDPLLQEAVDMVSSFRRTPKVQRVVQRLATTKRRRAVIDRLVAEGTLRTEQRRVLGVFSVTRHPMAAIEEAERLRAEVADLLTDRIDAHAVDDRLVMLAALAGSTSLVDGLVDRSERRDAKKRAKEFGEGDGISPAVREAIQAAQAATVAVIAAGSAASSSSSS
jgi:golgi phosphoprotein 3